MADQAAPLLRLLTADYGPMADMLKGGSNVCFRRYSGDI